MSSQKHCELDIRIPFESKENAETISEVLKVDINQHDRFVDQEIAVKDDSLCVHITATRPKDLRSGSSAFFESFLLCNEIINEFATPNKAAV